MATLILQGVGRMVGGEIGGPIGALVGRTLGKIAGQALTGRQGRATEGPRLATMPGLAASEGAPIPRVYGRARIGGQIIWATRFVETTIVTRTGAAGGKSLNKGGKSTTYAYAANFAVGLCEGPVAFVRRVWANGREIDRSTITMRVHRGEEDQSPDPLIVAKEGAENAPAYRGLAYVVFENLPLAEYGDRIPQLSFEVVRPVAGLCDMIRAVDIIPGASEYAYGVNAYMQASGGVAQSENRHQLFGASDWTASLDALQALCPNLKRVALVVSWFGDDMRAGACRIAPRVESRSKTITGASWSVAGLDRARAQLVSQIDGKPAYGGAPSDDVVRGAIADLRARGLDVLFYPFVMMDVPIGNALPDPATGAAGQTPFGWRGEIRPAATDGSAAVRAEIDAFFGAGDETWTYSRFIRHYARLCAEAGGVEAFLLGSEMRGLTHARDDAGAFPAVTRLRALAAEARALLGAGVKLSYAADWTEYGARVHDGGRDLRFPLDALWSAPEIDFVGVDAYFPMSDWRRAPAHADAALARSVYDRDYLAAQLGAGEAYDYHYASEAARRAQRRSPITDGAHGKPWVFRAKDLVNWWSQPHVERVGGVEVSPTAWRPRSKPIWFVEAGCPAVDLGSNAPNVFPDAKFAEQARPPFSAGARDDLMQIRALEAFIQRFDPRCAGHDPTHNPASDLYAGRMVDPDRIYLWAYDARPFPAFPMLATIWSDATSWDKGHWLNGRLEAAPLDALVPRLLRDFGESAPSRPPLDFLIEGFVVDRPMSARAALEPLAEVAGFEATVSAGALRFQHRGQGAGTRLTLDDLAPQSGGDLVRCTRAPDSALPRELAFAYVNAEFDYAAAVASSRRLDGTALRSAAGDLALVAHEGAMRRAADLRLQEIWAARETAEAHVRATCLRLEPGDAVLLPSAGGERRFRIARIREGARRELVCVSVDPAGVDHVEPDVARAHAAAPRLPGPPRVELLDLASARDDPPALQYVAAFADPWPGEIAIWRAAASGDFVYAGALTRNAGMGETLDPLGPGPVARFDRATQFRVALRGAFLSSCDERAVLAGANRLAVRGPDDRWEIIGFARAELVAEQTWLLSHLLRGLGGEEALAARTTPPGATVVLLDEALRPVTSSLDGIGVERRLRIGPATRDHADASYVEVTSRPSAIALRPYAPVRARAVRSAQGVGISFIRRARRQADGWEMVEIPLDEASEAYRVEILAGATVKRAIACASTACLYPADQELADFGAPLTTIDLRIAQWSAVAGAGFPLETSIPVL